MPVSLYPGILYLVRLGTTMEYHHIGAGGDLCPASGLAALARAQIHATFPDLPTPALESRIVKKSHLMRGQHTSQIVLVTGILAHDAPEILIL